MTIENQYQNVTDNLNVTNNEVRILDLLVDTNNMFYDYSKNRVISFIHGRNFHLVLYNAQTDDRGFTMYAVEDFCEHEGDLVILRNIFNRTLQSGLNNYLIRMAKSKVEDIFYMTDTFRALFKKPKSMDDYEVKYPTFPSSLTY
ncbi:MAG: hypothetical protein H7339_17555 [Arcicella sp.]|nr:hypothetical protein [Arcicella sp.]